MILEKLAKLAVGEGTLSAIRDVDTGWTGYWFTFYDGGERVKLAWLGEVSPDYMQDFGPREGDMN